LQIGTTLSVLLFAVVTFQAGLVFTVSSRGQFYSMHDFSISQVFHYFQTFEKDRRWIKYLVYPFTHPLYSPNVINDY
jgi:hypothetical protein